MCETIVGDIMALSKYPKKFMMKVLHKVTPKILTLFYLLMI